MRTKDNGKNNTAKDSIKKKHPAFAWFKRVTVVLCAVVMYFAVTIGMICIKMPLLRSVWLIR